MLDSVAVCAEYRSLQQECQVTDTITCALEQKRYDFHILGIPVVQFALSGV